MTIKNKMFRKLYRNQLAANSSKYRGIRDTVLNFLASEHMSFIMLQGQFLFKFFKHAHHQKKLAIVSTMVHSPLRYPINRVLKQQRAKNRALFTVRTFGVCHRFLERNVQKIEKTKIGSFVYLGYLFCFCLFFRMLVQPTVCSFIGSFVI